MNLHRPLLNHYLRKNINEFFQDSNVQRELSEVFTPIFDAKANVLATATVKTESYILALTDVSKVIEMNVVAANTLTVPPNVDVAFPIGSVIEIFQAGAGQTTITPGAGVTVLSEGSKLKTTAQYAVVSLRKRGTDEWVLTGNRTLI